jgi:imidazolonepropionase-like amidohydrolase
MAAAAESAVLFSNAQLVDGTTQDAREGYNVLVEGGRIREVSDRPITAKSAHTIDLGGKVLMPGLIDCHVHVVAGLPSLGGSAALPNSLVAARAAVAMKSMLMRGFTTVRDVGGADHGLVMAVDEGSIIGPRLVICGKALSQTGGHADFRGRFDDRPPTHYPSRLGAVGRVVDGVPDIRRAAREEIKSGARFIKIMANGGVASPTDPIQFLGFSREEMAAVVEEARMAQTYVAGHLYTDEAIRRFIECGGHSVEHGNLATADTARLIREQGAVVVPTLVTFEALAEEGKALGFPPESLAKIAEVRGAGLGSLEIFREAGVTMAYGTDLLGPMQRHQSREFEIRTRVLTPFEVIRSATVNAATLVQSALPAPVGVIEPDALADLIVVEDNPLRDIRCLTGEGERILAIMKQGVLFKNKLEA